MKTVIKVADKDIELFFGTTARIKIRQDMGDPVAALGEGAIDELLVGLIVSGSSKTRFTKPEIGKLLDKHFEQNKETERANLVIKLLYAYSKGLPVKEGKRLTEALDDAFAEFLEEEGETPLGSATSNTSKS